MYVLNNWRDPYDEGFSICSSKRTEFKEGLTVLVGCNGIGKTTTLHNLREQLRKENIPWFEYDNLYDGKRSADEALMSGNFGLVAQLKFSSEGESIYTNISAIASKIGKFVTSGENKHNLFANIFGDGDKEEIKSNKRFILFDAVDSGFSIDNVIEIKSLFNFIIKDAQKRGLEIYIIISCNEYELADGSNCMDVTTGKYLKFNNYEEYKKFILDTREKKNKRYEKATKTKKDTSNR